MKGYNTPNGFMGYISGRYILFCCESEYMDFYRELENAA